MKRSSSLPPLLDHSQLMKALSEPFPDEALRLIEKTGMTEIIPAYEIERLNQVFGIGGWHAKYSQETCTNIGIDPERDQWFEATCKCVLTAPRYSIRIEQNGGSKNSDRGDAEKGAKTDALGKCCSILGIGGDVYKRLRVVQQMPKIEQYGTQENGLQYSRNHKYVYVSGIISERVHERETDNAWLLVNGLLCLTSYSVIFNLTAHLPGSTPVGKQLHAHALWESPKKGQRFLRITQIIDIRSFEPIQVPELKESSK